MFKQCCAHDPLRKALRHPKLLDHARTFLTGPYNPAGNQKVNRTIRLSYSTTVGTFRAPKNPIVLAHGLLGFSELYLAGKHLPAIHYWRGIREVLAAHGVKVYTATVPPSASIEHRAQKLSEDVFRQVQGQRVNIVAHSMGGLDSRYMISHLKPPNVGVASLTTIATPHHGSAFADHMIDRFSRVPLNKVFDVLQSVGIESGAFSQLTRKYMNEVFNPATPDRDDVRYFSYGAVFNPSIWSAFHYSHRIVEEAEGANDGLVSVASAKWANYKGTLDETSHLDLINWTNRLRRLLWKLLGYERQFDAVNFYLTIAQMLADEGL